MVAGASLSGHSASAFGKQRVKESGALLESLKACPSDPLPPVRLSLLKVPQLLKTARDPVFNYVSL